MPFLEYVKEIVKSKKGVYSYLNLLPLVDQVRERVRQQTGEEPSLHHSIISVRRAITEEGHLAIRDGFLYPSE